MVRPGKTIEGKDRSLAQRSAGKLAGKLGGMSLNRQLLALSLWPFLEQILGFFVSTVDLLLATRMEDGEAMVAIMDAMGLAGYVGWLMAILQSAVATGVMAIVSRAAGARDGASAREGVVQGIVVAFVIGLASGLLIWLLLPSLVGWMGLSGDAALKAWAYLSITCLSCPVMGVLFAANNGLRAVGDTRTPFCVMALINVVNVALSWLFVFGPEPLGGMGIEGLAWGSVAAWAVGALVILGWLFREEKEVDGDDVGITLSLRGVSWRPQGGMMMRIGRVGLPQGAEMLGMWAIHAYVLSCITSLPYTGALGAHFVAIRVESISFLPGFAIGTAAATLVGQYLGARNPEMAMRVLKKACWFGVVFMSLMGVFFLFVPEMIVRLIVPERGDEASRLIHLAGPLVFLCGVFQAPLAISMILKIGLRGAGATRTVMMWSFVSLIGFRIVVMTLVDWMGWISLEMIWVVMSVDIFVQAGIFLVILYRGKWVSAKV